ncbi:unnamed protein product [Cladocopium goreaui]|uniref:Uncharacterized protein n=1 Tax=Cladocopium goreaui TaxID=2562237 RepID=A0A9P1GKZ0_9DINO|nr:unnamed protein product [Cladocopium goreaui]
MDDVGGFAPLSAEWKSVLQDSKPGCCVADVADVGNRKKVAMMRWCLAECHRQVQRQRAREALCISLAQDQRGRRFLVRFRNPDLEVCEGTLQLIKASSSPDNPGAQGIREMTLKALQSNDMMNKVECMAADAAADEQRAMRDLAGISGPDIMQLQDVMGQAFKNSKVLGKGRAHPAQRMLSRPLAADPQLKEIADEFVEKPQSVARLVANRAACLASLQFLSAEKALLLGMLADAALELHRFARACVHVGLAKVMLQHLAEPRLRKQLENGERANCLQKFADAIGVNGAALKYEFGHFLPIASKFAHVEGLENFHAWRKAIRCTQKNRMAHSAEALIPALARLGCWSCSSSGCELGFSVAQNVKQLGQSQDENINSKEVLLKKLKDGEAGFLQGCAMVNDEFANPDSAASSVLPKRVTSAEQIAQVFGEKQMAEIAFCDEERRKAVIEEPLLVVMPASDITDEMRTLAETYADKLAKTQRAAWVDNLPVYVHDVPAVHLPPEVVVARHIHAGRIFACKDPTDVTPPVLLFAGLVGGVLGNKLFVETKGAHGITVAYKPAIKTKRLLFLTPAFVQAHRAECLQLTEVLQLVDCKWQLLNREGLNDAIPKLNAAKARQLLVVRNDPTDESFPQVRLQFTGLEEAVAHWAFCAEDKSRCRTGIAGSY